MEKTKGQNLTPNQIKAAIEILSKTEKYDKFIILEDGTLYGATKLK